MCGYGPNLLGYNNAEVDHAVNEQRKKIDLGNGPSALVVDLAEKLITLVDSADWALFAKNGTDATTTCLTISRAATGKKKILVAKGSYHGSAPWCTPVANGVVEEDTSNLIFFEYNDSASLEDAEKKVEDVEKILNDETAVVLGPKTKYKPQDLKEDLISSAEV